MTIEQAGSIPFRARDGGTEYLLITSSDGLTWGFPKGTIELGDSPFETAARETTEEAGVEGDILEPALGEYRYEKSDHVHHVIVYALRVTTELDEWQEKGRRRRQWCSREAALELIWFDDLRCLLQLAAHRVEA